MSNSIYAIVALRERLDAFLNKLRQRGEEIASEAREAAAELHQYDPDEYKRSYNAFKAGINKQMRDLTSKAEKVFEQQFAIFEHSADDDVHRVYDDAEDAVEHFIDYIENLSERIFSAVDSSDAETKFNQAVAEWKRAAESFTCSQCSAPIPVPQLYYQSQYLPCLGCGTQANFVPSSAMQNAPQLAEALADERTEAARTEYERLAISANAETELLVELRYLLERHRVLVELLPAYAETRVGTLRRTVVDKRAELNESARRAVVADLGTQLQVLRDAQDTVLAEVVAGIINELEPTSN